MTDTTHPSKQLVRDYLDSRTRSTEPPPTPAEVRRQLGWELLPQNRQPDRVDEPQAYRLTLQSRPLQLQCEPGR
ncbi:hypothetical protein RugamoR1_30700 [Rugamonas sp. R1(2021)]